MTKAKKAKAENDVAIADLIEKIAGVLMENRSVNAEQYIQNSLAALSEILFFTIAGSEGTRERAIENVDALHRFLRAGMDDYFMTSEGGNNTIPPSSTGH